MNKTESKHTSGPWISEHPVVVSYLGLERFLKSRPDAVVVVMPKPPFALGACGAIVLGENAEANAAIIAAAPDLLAACDTALAVLEDHAPLVAEHHPFGPQRENCEGAIKQLREAIARTTPAEVERKEV